MLVNVDFVEVVLRVVESDLDVFDVVYVVMVLY